MTAPLLLVGHGTVDATGVAEFVAFTDRLRRAAGRRGRRRRRRVHRAGPADRARGLDRAGRRAGTAGWPRCRWCWSAAGHAKGDIPAALQREVLRDPGSGYAFGRPLGPHPVLQELLADRIDAALRSRPADGTAVLLVGRGSTDPDANAEVCKVARLLQEGRAVRRSSRPRSSRWPARTCRPGWPAARALGARRVVVAPVLPVRRGAAAPGRRTRPGRSRPQHPELDVRAAGHLGDCAELAGLVRRALPGGAARRHPDELRHLRLPGAAARLRGQARRPADPAPPPGRPGRTATATGTGTRRRDE